MCKTKRKFFRRFRKGVFEWFREMSWPMLVFTFLVQICAIVSYWYLAQRTCLIHGSTLNFVLLFAEMILFLLATIQGFLVLLEMRPMSPRSLRRINYKSRYGDSIPFSQQSVAYSAGILVASPVDSPVLPSPSRSPLPSPSTYFNYSYRQACSTNAKQATNKNIERKCSQSYSKSSHTKVPELVTTEPNLKGATVSESDKIMPTSPNNCLPSHFSKSTRNKSSTDAHSNVKFQDKRGFNRSQIFRYYPEGRSSTIERDSELLMQKVKVNSRSTPHQGRYYTRPASSQSVNIPIAFHGYENSKRSLDMPVLQNEIDSRYAFVNPVADPLFFEYDSHINRPETNQYFLNNGMYLDKPVAQVTENTGSYNKAVSKCYINQSFTHDRHTFEVPINQIKTESKIIDSHPTTKANVTTSSESTEKFKLHSIQIIQRTSFMERIFTLTIL